MIRIFSYDYWLIKKVDGHGTSDLRRLGWVFFDDLSRLRSFGLPLPAKASWFTKEALRHIANRLIPSLSDSALAVPLTEDEWGSVSAGNYSPKDRGDDFEAKARFVAGARAVVDFTSNQLPRMD